MLRSLALAALSITAVNSFASYEMILAPSSYSQSVHRYDPENQVYLGEFGQGRLANPTGIVLDQATGSAFIADNRVVHQFNYFTGRHISTINIPGLTGLATSMSLAPDGNFVVTDGEGVVKINRAGSLLNTVTAYPNNRIAAVYQRPNGLYWMVTSNPGLGGLYVTIHSAAGTPITYTTLRTGLTNVGNDIRGGMAFKDNRVVLTVSPQIGSYYDGVNVYQGTFTDAGSLTVGTVPFFTQWTPGQVTNPVYSHSTISYHLVRDQIVSPADAAVAAVNPIGNLGTIYRPTGAFETNIAQGGIRQIAIVTAPEPATMVALGLGACAMLRRKRRA